MNISNCPASIPVLRVCDFMNIPLWRKPGSAVRGSTERFLHWSTEPKSLAASDGENTDTWKLGEFQDYCTNISPLNAQVSTTHFKSSSCGRRRWGQSMHMCPPTFKPVGTRPRCPPVPTLLDAYKIGPKVFCKPRLGNRKKYQPILIPIPKKFQIHIPIPIPIPLWITIPIPNVSKKLITSIPIPIQQYNIFKPDLNKYEKKGKKVNSFLKTVRYTHTSI